MRQLLQVANPVAGFLYHISMHAFVHSNFRIDDFAQEISMQYCGSEYTIELGWSVTIVWCKQSRRMQNCPRRPLSTTHFHLMETLRVRLLLIWSGIGWAYATRDSMFACPTIRTRDARTDLANLSRKRPWKNIIGHPRVSQLHSARRAEKLTGCLLHVVIIPSTFRNSIKARTCSYGYTARQATTTWTPCISYTCAKERLMIDLLTISCNRKGRGDQGFIAVF
jgi:hypothetical protein